MSKSKFLNKRVKITKVIDDVFDSKHPNGINEGYQAIGTLMHFEIGLSAYLLKDDNRTFYSSPIREINEEAGIFETAHSTYSIELLAEQEEDCEKALVKETMKEENYPVTDDEAPYENGQEANEAGPAFGGLNMQ